MGEVVVLRGRVARRLREEAERLGVTVDEYVLDLLSRNLDPEGRALEYAEAARDLLEEARESLSRGEVRQAAEKAWGAAALAVKAYAYWVEGRRLASHGELWEFMRRIARELGSWVRDSWNAAVAMHTCFYEGWCAGEDVEEALNRIERLVGEVERRVKRGRAPAGG